MSSFSYSDLKKKHSDEINKFPFIFAFTNEQLAKGLKKAGLNETDTDKIVSLGSGTFIKKTDKENLSEMMSNHEKELKEAIKNDTTGEGFIYDMFNYELANHEYIVDYDPSGAIESLGLTMEEIKNNKNLWSGYQKAIKHQQESDY